MFQNPPGLMLLLARYLILTRARWYFVPLGANKTLRRHASRLAYESLQLHVSSAFLRPTLTGGDWPLNYRVAQRWEGAQPAFGRSHLSLQEAGSRVTALCQVKGLRYMSKIYGVEAFLEICIAREQ